MKNIEMIKQVEAHIESLEAQKQGIEAQIEAAKKYLNVLNGHNTLEIRPVVSDKSLKGNQTLEAREKMRKAQHERQQRIRNMRYETIKEFLSARTSATIKELAECLKLKENAAKRYVRECPDVKEIGINIWQYKAN